MIGKKLKLFKDRTKPLVDFYKSNNATIIKIEVKSNTQPTDILKQLKR